jgi:hypothetical protein
MFFGAGYKGIVLIKAKINCHPERQAEQCIQERILFQTSTLSTEKPG